MWKWTVTIVGNDIFITDTEVEAADFTAACAAAVLAVRSFQRQTIEALEIASITREDIEL